MSVHEQTYLPAELDTDLIAALEEGKDSAVFLDLPGNSRVALPSQLAAMLRQVVQAMSEGLAVTVRPQTRQLTTSQVADLLGVTRPTVVNLLESGAIPFIKVGTHRRVDLSDALRYRNSRREAQYQFIADTQTDDQTLSEMADDMVTIRAHLAEQRRSARD